MMDNGRPLEERLSPDFFCSSLDCLDYLDRMENWHRSPPELLLF